MSLFIHLGYTNYDSSQNVQYFVTKWQFFNRIIYTDAADGTFFSSTI